MRTNRVVLALTGALLLAAGVAGLLVVTGVIAMPEPAEVYGDLVHAVAERPVLATAAAFTAGILVLLVGAWLVRRQFAIPQRGGPDTLTLHRGRRGRTSLKAAAVANVTAADLKRTPGVVDSRVRLVTFGDRPRLRVRLDVHADADLAAVRATAEEVYARLCRILHVTAVHVDTRLRPSDRAPARVE